MGKLRQRDSDNEMDIEQQPVGMQIEEPLNKAWKKNKKIVKNRKVEGVNNKSEANSSKKNVSQQIIKKTAKLVNLKKKQKPLQQKQEIFKKVIKGLQGSGVSKKQKRKNRLILKKQLHKALEWKQNHKIKAEQSTMQSQTFQIQRIKKEPINQKQEVQKIRNAMGQSLSSLKNMLANKKS